MNARPTSVHHPEHAKQAGHSEHTEHTEHVQGTGGIARGPDAVDRPRRWRSPLTWLLTALVDLYRLTAPMRQPRCRFYPSCSSYARQALSAHGSVRGTYLTVRRLLRCHPWNPGGVDHVPPRSPLLPRSPKA